MDLPFYKIRQFRSDFVLIPRGNSATDDDEVASEVARRIARRRYGIGASGVLFVTDDLASESKPALRFYDRAGTRRRVTADALACAARYLFDSGKTDGSVVRFASDGMPAAAEALDSRQFRIGIGAPKRASSEEELDPSPSADFTERVVIEGHEYTITRIRLLESCAVFLPIPGHVNPFDLDASVKASRSVPGAIPAYVRPKTPESIQLYSWPGSAQGIADYTAIASCAAVASISSGYADGVVLVSHGEDTAFVYWDASTNLVTATVSPTYVFSGDVHVDIDE